MKLKLKARVIHGRKYGRKIGYPTANLDGRSNRLITGKIKPGIYAGLVRRQKTKKVYKAALLAQPRPAKRYLQIEGHLLNFKGGLYGENLEFEFKKFIRPWRRFTTREKMITQIKKDLALISSSNFV